MLAKHQVFSWGGFWAKMTKYYDGSFVEAVVEVLGVYLKDFYGWLSTSGVTLVGALIAAFIVHRYGSRIIRKVVELVIDDPNDRVEKNKEETIIRTVHGVMDVGLFVGIFFLFLSKIGVDAKSLMATAGVAGIAIGFGGRYITEDIFAGFFIIYGNQYHVGDIVCLNGITGIVMDINLRMTTLRDLGGVVHYIRHGIITKASNLTRDFSRVDLDIAISTNEDQRKAIAVINKVGQEMAEDITWKDRIQKAPEVDRHVKYGFNNWSIVYKVIGDTTPGDQWDVRTELVIRLNIAFKEKGIEFVIYNLAKAHSSDPVEEGLKRLSLVSVQTDKK